MGKPSGRGKVIGNGKEVVLLSPSLRATSPMLTGSGKRKVKSLPVPPT